MKTIENAAGLIKDAAQRLLKQHKYSNGYLSVGDSDITEANIVIQVAASFIGSQCHVWAESPFKEHEGDQCKHLDLLVDVASGDPEYSRLLTIEAKRITAGENDKKIDHAFDRSSEIQGRSGEMVRITVKTPTGERTIEGSDVLVAAGRGPNTEELNLSGRGANGLARLRAGQ